MMMPMMKRYGLAATQNSLTDLVNCSCIMILHMKSIWIHSLQRQDVIVLHTCIRHSLCFGSAASIAKSPLSMPLREHMSPCIS